MDRTPVSLLESPHQPAAADAWARFVQLYTPLLFYWARRLARADADAADLVQEVFATLVQKLPTFLNGYATYAVTATNSYDEENPNPTTVTVVVASTDFPGRGQVGKGKVTSIADAPLDDPEFHDLATVAGRELPGGLVVGQFTDDTKTAKPGDFSGTIDWGDGETSPISSVSLVGLTADGMAQIFQVHGTKPSSRYKEDGQYTIHVQVNDDGGSSTTVDSHAEVSEGDMTAIAAPKVQAVEGLKFTATVATFNDLRVYPLAGYPNGKIREGMTADEVVAILGAPHERHRRDHGEWWLYWLDSYTLGWFAVTFDEGRVVGTGGD